MDASGTTVYVGAVEVLINATQRITRTYYSAGAQLVAMRVMTSTGGNTLYYLHSDHLGSTSLTTNSSGGEVARQKYYPYGQIRPGGTGSMPTDVGFTGQRLDSYTGGLMFYRARYYSPAIGRFVSADTIIPQPENPQAWNRYSYVVNNPLKYTDPTGHCFLICGLIGAVVGLVAYTADAVINQTGWNLGDAVISTGTGFAVGATLGVAAPVVMAAAAETIAGVSAVTGSGTLATAATGLYEAATAVAAVDTIAIGAIQSRLSGTGPSPIGVPRGFADAGQFNQATSELKDALQTSGINDARIGVRGSAVTGVSSKGGPFRLAAEGGLPPSDIDFYVESDQLTRGMTTSRSIPGFVHPNKLLDQYPDLKSWSSRWSTILGREVTPGGFVPGTVPNEPRIEVP